MIEFLHAIRVTPETSTVNKGLGLGRVENDSQPRGQPCSHSAIKLAFNPRVLRSIELPGILRAGWVAVVTT
jgi:hypothetical protein